MTLEDLIAVSGMSGLYKVAASRNNGLIIEDIDTGKSKFVSMRKHQFTPLGTVAIYTELDAVELKLVFDKMAELEPDMPPPATNLPSNQLFEYFANVLPEYDRDRVMASDVKKVIKWYQFLKSRSLYPFTSSEEESSEEE